MFRLHKNEHGVLPHLVIPVVVVLAVASVGTYVLAKSKAATTNVSGVSEVVTASGLFGFNCNSYPPPTLTQGSTGVCVKVIQTGLNNYISAYDFLGHKSVPTAGTVDGIFGPKTAAAVKFYKVQHNLPADSIAGPAFWSAFTRSCLTLGGGANCFASGVYN